MKRLGFALGLLGAVGICTQRASADTTSLQSILTNVNGTTSTDFTGYNTAGFNTTSTCGPKGTDFCGTGTLTYTYNPGPGTYFFDVFFDHSLNETFWNEYGTVNGAHAAGQSYEIGDSFGSNIYNDVLAGGALPNTNTLPGQTSNFLLNCVGATCNGDFSAAMGFSFTLGAGEQEVITLNVSHTNPGGFSLQDTHPIDPANSVALQLYISGNAATVPVGGTVPEPNLVILLAVMGIVLVVWRKVTEMSVQGRGESK